VKKLPLFLILFFASLALWAVNETPAGWAVNETPAGIEGNTPQTESANSGPDGLGEEEETPQAPPPRRKEPRMKNRGFEIGIANFSVGFANDFVATDNFLKRTALTDLFQTGEIFKDVVEIDIDKFLDGFSFDFGLNVRPFFFNINVKDKWGFGLDVARISTAGYFEISENLLGLKQVKNDTAIGAGAAVFVDVGIPIFFHINQFKIDFRPSVFVPLAYVPPGGITYTYKRSNGEYGGVKIAVKYNLGIYTPIPMEEFMKDGESPDPLAMGQALLDNWEGFGYDFDLGVEYPWDASLDLGVKLTNFPFIAADLDYRMGMKGKAWVDTGKIDIEDLIKNEGDIDFDALKEEGAFGYPEDEDLDFKYTKSNLKVLRPFKLVAYADWRPFNTRLISFIPSLGFAVNPLYTEPGSIEGGLSLRLDLGNIFVATFGINYNDRKWKNSIDVTLLNLYLFQIDLGLVFQSQDFAESWNGAGFALNFGFKFGF
jgi:hypothetical protein